MLKLTVDRVHVERDEKIAEYINEKIGKLDNYLPRHARRSVHAVVRLKRGPGRGKKQTICEVVIHLPKGTITANQTADSPEAAIDTAEAKLKNQLKKYKDKQLHSRRHRLLRRLRF